MLKCISSNNSNLATSNKLSNLILHRTNTTIHYRCSSFLMRTLREKRVDVMDICELSCRHKLVTWYRFSFEKSQEGAYFSHQNISYQSLSWRRPEGYSVIYYYPKVGEGATPFPGPLTPECWYSFINLGRRKGWVDLSVMKWVDLSAHELKI